MIKSLLITCLLAILSSGLCADEVNQLLENRTQQSGQSSTKQQWDLSVLDEEEDDEDIDLQAVENTDNFLPVDEAYQLSITRSDKGLVLDWVIADHYYLYGEQFRFNVDGQPLSAQLPKGKIAFDPIFEKDVEKHYHFVQAVISSESLPQQPFSLGVTSQGCADAGLCYPPRSLSFLVDGNQITAVTATASAETLNRPSAPQANLGTITFMLVSAILGGMILNLMPCVLPVLSLKALSMANSEANHKAQGWSYTLGAVTTFTLIAAVLLAVRAAGQAVGWGFQLQSPGFVTLLIFLFFIMGLSLSGYITIGTRWMSAGQSLTQGSGFKQSYFTGVLAAVVASPCTAPFMAPAIGFAMTQPWLLSLLVFASLGFGMALPLLLLSYIPQLEHWLPKPGAWMETFKQALAFPLYLTGLWLLWVLGQQLGVNAATIALMGCLGITFIFWLANHVSSIRKSACWLSIGVAVLLSWQITQIPPQTHESSNASNAWEVYSPQRLAKLRSEGKAVFINMTADWCITCKANEKLVFTDETLTHMKNKQIVLLKGDWTNYNPEITKLLEKYNRGGVPLYLLFPAKVGAEAKLLPQILSPGKFEQAINSI